ncbi:hypothetical protein SAMN00777080_2061 [Aquiflexum balticum DSM 16537]|uniref:Outer membrane protein beta-barrel domain-containing protein n=1 Tax=Aquiflexum balticum DSM 16537 TaxID=758820 RepID=A0A1W2H3L7_9BACT|nr:hypothetical protein [Aquiflexum balticum]SMD43469.1 hypothetical protein SAMN00777080_2061 [Aquiflexum balticum DSM 16537]
MKKLLFLLAFVPLVSFGQFSKGTKMIGADLSYTSIKYEISSDVPTTNTFFSVTGHMGFFMSESFALGPIVNVFANNTPSFNPVTNLFEDRKTNGLAGGIYARKFFTISEQFFFSLEGRGLIGTINRDENSSSGEEKNTRLNLSFRPVFTFMPNRKWGFDAGIGQIYYSSNWTNSSIRERYFQTNLGQVSLGVNYFIGR